MARAVKSGGQCGLKREIEVRDRFYTAVTFPTSFRNKQLVANPWVTTPTRLQTPSSRPLRRSPPIRGPTPTEIDILVVERGL